MLHYLKANKMSKLRGIIIRQKIAVLGIILP